MTAQKFDELTHWDKIPTFLGLKNPLENNGFDPGWRPPGQSWHIGTGDDYWDRVLEKARIAYGDPNIRYDTDINTEDRHLVFRDGTRLPTDGTIVYRNTDTDQTWIQNNDGTVALRGPDGNPVGVPVTPADYHQLNGKWFPVDKDGHQIGPQVDSPPPSFDKDRAAGDGGTPKVGPSPVDTGDMEKPVYPDWATKADPDIPNQMTAILVELYQMFGKGQPVGGDLPEFPFNVNHGAGSGIDNYDAVKVQFLALADEFNKAVTAFNKAIADSEFDRNEGKRAIDSAIRDFNTKVTILADGDWTNLLSAETRLIESAKKTVADAAAAVRDLPGTPGGDMAGTSWPSDSGVPLNNGTSVFPMDNGTGVSPMGTGQYPSSPVIPTGNTTTKNADDLVSRLLPSLAAGLGANTWANTAGQGLTNPLSSALSGLGGLGNLGASIGASAKPIDRLEDDEDDEKDDEERDKAVEPLAPPVTPTQSPQHAPAVHAGATGENDGTAQPVSAVAAGTPAPKTTVILPDGREIEAPNAQAAEAARNALADNDGSGDAAQKAYADTGVEIPSDGKNPGAKVDPSDLQAGDIAKWQDKTMVAVGPGLLAVPGQPGEVVTVAEALKDSTGFHGFYRPWEVDPTLSSPTSAPPLIDLSTPPPSSVPEPPNDNGSTPGTPPADQSQPEPQKPDTRQQDSPPRPSTAPASRADAESSPEPQPAPPSPFAASPEIPPATRTTKQERIAAGQS